MICVVCSGTKLFSLRHKYMYSISIDCEYHNSEFSVYSVCQFINNKYICLILPIKWTTIHNFMCLTRVVNKYIARKQLCSCLVHMCSAIKLMSARVKLCVWVWLINQNTLFFLWRSSPQWARASSLTKFLDHTWRTTVGRTPLDEWSAHRRDLYLTTQTSMPLAGFEPTISAGEWPQNYALDCAAIGTGNNTVTL